VAENVLELGIDVLTARAEADLRSFARKTEAEMKAMATRVSQANIGAATSIGGPMSRVAMHINSAVKKQDEFNERWGNTMRLGQQVGAGITAAGTAMAFGLGLAYKSAADFDQAMRNVNSIAKVSEQEFAKLTAAVKGIASDSKITDAPATLAAGLYDIYSSGLQGKIALEALEIASKGAAAGMTDTATSSQVLVAAMNAYGKKGAGDAAKLMDVLFKTVDRGVVTFEQLAGSLGNVLGTAAQIKVPVEQVGAAIATMTKQGIGPEEAITSLNAVMMQFLSPSKEFAAAIKKAGFESGLAVIKQKGLTGAIDMLVKSTGGAQDKMAQMLGEVRAVRGAMALTGEGAKMFATDLEAFGKSAGSLNSALAQQSQGAVFRQREAMKQFQLALISVGDSLKIVAGAIAPFVSWIAKMTAAVASTKIGQVLIIMAAGFTALALAIGPLLMALPGLLLLFPQLAAALSGLGAGGGILASVGAGFASIGGVIGWIVTVAIPAVLGAAATIGGIIAGILASPAALVAAVLAVVAAIGVGIYALVKNWDAVKAWFADLPKVIGKTVADIANGIAYAVGWAFGFFISIPQRLSDAYKAVREWSVQTYKSLIAWFKNLPNAIAQGFASAYTAVSNALSHLWSSVMDFFSNLWTSLLRLPGRIIDAVVDVFKRMWNSFRTGFKPGQYFAAGMAAGSGGRLAAPVPGRAKGGPVNPNEMYLVGERGPEYFIPKQAGDVFTPTQIPSSPFGAGYVNPRDRYENTIFGGLREIRPLITAAQAAVKTVVQVVQKSAPVVAPQQLATAGGPPITMRGMFPQGTAQYEASKLRAVFEKSPLWDPRGDLSERRRGSWIGGYRTTFSPEVVVNVTVEGNIYGDKQFEHAVDDRVYSAVKKAVQAH
jgi:TP901 family phage tail tape measure protein